MSKAEEALPPGFHDRPVLVVDPGQHTAIINRADADALGCFAVTASADKTVRVWSLANGRLERTIRLPAGPGNVGKSYATAIDPLGQVIAAAGWTGSDLEGEQIYIYDRATGALRLRIGGLPDVVHHLAFSPNGQHLAATLGGPNGLRVFSRDRNWSEVARDAAYGNSSYGAAFAPDGCLATTSLDGLVRLYGPDLQLWASTKPPGGARPFGVAVSPDGTRVAVGYDDSTALDVLDGRNLTLLDPVATDGIDNGNLFVVAWAADGTLVASGRYRDGAVRPVLAWAADGRGNRRALQAGPHTAMSLTPLPYGNLLVAGGGLRLVPLTSAGHSGWTLPSPVADLRGQQATLAVSADGATLNFGFEALGHAPARFDLGRLALTQSPPTDNHTVVPLQQGLPVADWVDSDQPTLGGAPLPLQLFERSRSIALHPNAGCFVVGTEWWLRAFDACGTLLWRQEVPSAAWAVNVTGDGRLVVAGYGDGTIRWHRMEDGREVLAFMPLADRRNWVAWTPEGFYAASPGGHGVLRWHVNQAGWQPAKDYFVSDIPGFHRPEAIKLVLQEMETPRAVGLAIIAEQRRKVQLLTNSRVPPGARLHMLVIGVSRYDVAHLRLEYAQQDAHDVVSALTSTQASLYTIGSPQYLADADATRPTIRRALETLRNAMTGPHDFAVVYFSGHGAMVDGELYLLPQDVRVGDAVALKDSALPVAILRAELTRIAQRGGRVLVLLDACYSGGASADGSAQPAASNVLSTALAAANITVLTSSSASQASREDPAWRNGAFTEALLEALGPDADTNHDGLISATELAAYIACRVPALTEGRQTPAMEVRFDGTLFAVR